MLYYFTPKRMTGVFPGYQCHLKWRISVLRRSKWQAFTNYGTSYGICATRVFPFGSAQTTLFYSVLYSTLHKCSNRSGGAIPLSTVQCTRKKINENHAAVGRAETQKQNREGELPPAHQIFRLHRAETNTVQNKDYCQKAGRSA